MTDHTADHAEYTSDPSRPTGEQGTASWSSEGSGRPTNGTTTADENRALTPWQPLPNSGGQSVPPNTNGSPEPGTSLDLHAILAAFQRRWFVAFGIGFVLAIISAAVAWFVVPTPFTSFAELHVKSVQERLLFDTAEAETKFSDYKQTQIRRVLSPFVLNAALRKPEISKLSVIQEQEHPVDWLEKELSVTSPAAEFVRISLSGDNAKQLAAIVNAVTDAYIEEVVNSERNRRLERKNNLERIHREIEDKLRSKRNTMRKLAESLHTASSTALTVKQQMAIEYFSQLRKEHARVRFELMRSKSQMTASTSTSETMGESTVPAPIIDAYLDQEPDILRLKNRITQLEQLLALYKQTITDPDNPLVAKQEAELNRVSENLESERERLRPRILERLQQENEARKAISSEQVAQQVALLTKQEEQLRQELEAQEVETKQIGIASFELESLQQEIEQIDEVSSSINEEIQKINIELQSPPRITLHRRAEVPFEPALMQRYLATGLAGFGVLGFVIVGIVWLETTARRISNVQEVTGGLCLPVVGSLPVMPRWMMHGNTSARNSGRSAVWQSVWTESVDSTRTMLLKDAQFDSRQVIMVCSALQGEGKTTLSSHLATSLARAGRQTVLIDFDLRRPTVHKMFELNRDPGLCEVLRGQVALEEVIREVRPAGLSVIPAGALTHDVLQTLAQGGARSLLNELRQMFDMVVVDSSPILPVTDSLLIAPEMDGIVFSIRRDVSQYGKVAAAYRRLAMLGANVLGSVVIGLDDGGFGSSYGSRYRYRYNNAYHYNTPVSGSPEDQVE